MSEVELVELSPLKSTTLLWRPQEGSLVLTVITKASYELKAGVTPLAEAQDDVNERDLHAQNNTKLGLYSASDLAPYKSQADVTVVGKAFSPPDELASALVARVKVGAVDKRIEIHADRYMRRDGRVRDKKFFSKMALGYERAPGGPHTNNPVGMDLVEQEDGRILLPNVQAVGETPSLAEPLTPCGFGPIPTSWPARQRLLDDTHRAWLEQDWAHAPVPANINWDFFNVAPRDQRLGVIRPDEEIILEHLHPEEATLQMKLPGKSPRVYVERSSGAQRVRMKGDTLWIDTNRLRCTLTWRGTVAVENEAEAMRVIVAMIEPGADLTWEAAWHLGEAKRHQNDAAPMSQRTPRPPVSSDQVQTRKAAKKRAKTAPVPLDKRADQIPAWVPEPGKEPSSPLSQGPMSVGPRSAPTPKKPLVVEVAFSAEEANMLRDLCQAMGYDTVAMIRHVLRESHQVRFAGQPSGPSSANPSSAGQPPVPSSSDSAPGDEPSSS